MGPWYPVPMHKEAPRAIYLVTFRLGVPFLSSQSQCDQISFTPCSLEAVPLPWEVAAQPLTAKVVVVIPDGNQRLAIVHCIVACKEGPPTKVPRKALVVTLNASN